MAAVIYILTILFGIVCWRLIKEKRYKAMPVVCAAMFISFVGCATIAVVSLCLPCGEMLLYPLGAVVFGLICILVGMNDLYSIWRCKEAVDGVCCGYRTYYGGNGVSTHAPVFEYMYHGVLYREQTAQGTSLKSWKQGRGYRLYIDPKHPAVYILTRRVKAGTAVSIVLGAFLLTFGMAALFTF